MTSSLSKSEAALLVQELAAQDIDMDAILRRRAAATPDEVALRFLKNGEDDIVEFDLRNATPVDSRMGEAGVEVV